MFGVENEEVLGEDGSLLVSSRLSGQVEEKRRRDDNSGKISLSASSTGTTESGDHHNSPQIAHQRKRVLIDNPVVVSMIHVLCRTGDAEQLETILEAIEIVDWLVPFEIALNKGHTDVVSVLVKAASPGWLDESYFTKRLEGALWDCLNFHYYNNGDNDEDDDHEQDDDDSKERCRREVQIIECLLQHGADGRSILPDTGTTPLCRALDANRIDIIRCLVATGGVNVNAPVSEENPQLWALEWACRVSRLNIVKCLVKEYGAMVNHLNEEDGSTPLTHAAAFDDWKIVRWLLRYAGADPNLATLGQKSFPLLAASQAHSVETVRVLLEHGSVAANVSDEDGDTPLHFLACVSSVRAGYDFKIQLETIKLLVRAGADVNAQNTSGCTPLYRICESNLREEYLIHLVKYLILEARANPGIANDGGQTALHLILSHRGSLEALQMFEEYDPGLLKSFDANCTISKGGTLLHAVVNTEACDANFVAGLLEKTNARVDTRDDDGCLPIHLARNWETVQVLITNGGAKVDNTDREENGPGRTILHYASSSEDVAADLVSKLVHQFGATVDYQDEEGNTPLHRACKHGMTDSVRCLVLGGGANPSMADSRLRTPLHRASENGHQEIVSFLLEQNVSRKTDQNGRKIHFPVDVNARDKYGKTALQWACIEGHLEVAHILVNEGGASAEVADNDGRYPLHRACEAARVDLADFLIKTKKADINVRDDHLETPIWQASRNGHVEMVKWLFEKVGANLNICDKHGDHPLHIACRKGHNELVEWMLQRPGVSVDLTNNYGETPLHYACHSKRIDTVKLLLLDGGASACIPDDKGRYALHSMFDKAPSAIMTRLLIEVGMADVKVIDKDDNSPLHRAFIKRRKLKTMPTTENILNLCLQEEDLRELPQQVNDQVQDFREGLVQVPPPTTGIDEENGAGGFDRINEEEDIIANENEESDEEEESDNDEEENEEEEENADNDEMDWESLLSDPFSDSFMTPCKFLQIVSIFLEHGARVTLPNKNGESVLFLACSDTDLDVETLYKMVHTSVSEGLFCQKSYHRGNEV